MGFKRFILLLVSVFYAFCSSAQIEGELVRSRILILLDESSSMVEPWAGGMPKYIAAHKIIMKLMDSVYGVNNQVEFGLRVFGHQHTVPENDCYDTKNEVPFSTDNRNQMFLRLEDIRPLGVTPIAFALEQAADNDLVDEAHNAYSIILITDGGESCGGNICEVMKKLVNSKVFFKPYIVSLENDPTLKTTYACMGNFLQVTDEADIPHAVKTIMDAFRPALRVTKKEFKEIQTTNIPSILKVDVPVKMWKIPEGDIFAEMPAAGLTLLNVDRPQEKKITVRVPDMPLPHFVTEQPVLPKAEALTALAIAGIKPVEVKPVFSKITTVKLSMKLPPVVVDTVALPKRDAIAKLKPAPLKHLNNLFAIDDHSINVIPVSPLPPIVKDKTPEPSKTQPKPEPKDDQKPEFKVEREDNAQTTVEVYLTNGLGKYYTTTPQVLLLDPKTNEVVKRFYRFVDADGNPDPQTDIQPGIYHLTFASNKSIVMPVTVLLNKKNKITVTVKNTSVSFEYKGPPFPPIKEGWTATITERDKTQGRVQDQRMNEKILYEPGNYHIEINTFPREIRNVDLDFDFETVIAVDHPGFVKFIPGDVKTNSVSLYQRLGDKFLAFYTLNLSDPRSQHLQIQPGEYQVHYQKGPGQGYAAEKVEEFKVKPNEETTVELK